MNLAATTYGIASAAVFVLMAMRPGVTLPPTPATAPQPATEVAAPAATDASASTPADPAIAPATETVVPVAPAPAEPAAIPPSAPPQDSGTPGQPGAPVVEPAPATPTTPAAPQPTSQTQPDYEREQRLANEIRDAILDGEVISLNDGNRDFMAIQTDAQQPRGAVIIAHGRGYHPDWPDVANPLRVGLVEKGWTTLSLQMPVLAKDAKYYDYVPLFSNASQRIEAGVKYLKDHNISPVILLGHSCGGHMAMQWVREHGDKAIAAYIGLGMGATDYQQFMAQPFPFASMSVPVLDLYGDKEYPSVIAMAPERLAMMHKAGNTQSKQMVMPEANHYFNGQGEALTMLVSTWLNSLQL